MTQLLFRNRWFALAWALALCFAISRFFGEDGGQQQLAQAADQIRSNRVVEAREASAVQQDLEENQVIRGREPREGDPAELSGETSDMPASENESAGETY